MYLVTINFKLAQVSYNLTMTPAVPLIKRNDAVLSSYKFLPKNNF